MSSSAASVLVEPFGAYLQRRARSSVDVSPGEAVTAAVGLLRGCRRVEPPAHLMRWWLSATGRPSAVFDDGGADPIAATAESLSELAAVIPDAPTRQLVQSARESVLTRPPREWEAVERRLFRHASPLPLILGPLAPVDRPVEAVTTLPTKAGGVLALVDADLSDAVWAAVRDLAQRWRASRPLRLTVVGVCAAALVLGVSMLMPSGDGGSGSTSVVPDAAVSAAATPAAAAAPTVDPRVPLSDDVAENARITLERAAQCQADTNCESETWEHGSPRGDALIPVTDATAVQMVDDFGGVSVVRVSDSSSAQYVTLVRRNDRWLVRTVKTITDQPS